MIQAAERGYTPAMLALARDYLHTQTPEALAKAFFWLKKAQELNDSDAQALFEAATKMGQEGEEASKDDKNLAECMETVEQPKVIDSLAFGSLSTPFEVADFPASVSASSPDSPHGSSASSDSSEGEETEPTTAEDYTISPQEIEQWQAEEAKWKEDIKNPKFVRERLQQAQKDFQNKQEVKEKPPLSSASTKTIETLRDKGVRFQITIDNLLSLFKDPYFQGQVDMFKTTDGYAIVGYNFLTGEAKSTGTHRKHNKSYKGLDANFLKSITELVDEFMTPSSIQGQF
ncbi:hypothetical protein QM565_19305 [Geitlerinema splendidum]|nr:hypothetical protein [Geitlerinema splendidum]